jgi:hypothetical protein
VAEAIADRMPIDWAAFRPRVSGDTRDRLFDALRSLDRLAIGATMTQPTIPTARTGVSALPRWALPGPALSVLVVAAGLLGAVIGVPQAGAAPVGLQLAGVLVFGSMGAWLLVGAVDSRGAWLGAFYLTIAASVAYSPMLWLLPLLPEGVFRAAVACLVPEVLMPLYLACFVRGFPRVPRWSFADRVSVINIRAAAVVAATCAAGHVLAVSRQPKAPHAHPAFGWLARSSSSDAYWQLLLLLGGLSLAVMLARRRRAEGDERARGSLFIAGVALGLTPTIALVVLHAAVPSVRQWLADPASFQGAAYLTGGLALTVPFTTAHAVRTQHVVSARFALRGALRPLLARSTLSVASLVPTGVLVAHLVRHSDRSLAALFSGGDALLSLGLTALGLAGIAARGPLLRRLDRVLMPRRGDWQASLFRASQNLRRARGADEVMDLLMREIKSTLGANGCIMPAVGEAYVSRGGRVASVRCESSLAVLSLAADGPFLVQPDSPGSLFRWLPDSERSLVVDGGIAVILPVPGGSEGPCALLALDAPMDGEPYSPEDLLYLGALATAGGMAIDSSNGDRRLHFARVTLGDRVAGECRACGLLHPEASEICACGASLEEALLPIVLNGKFRLTRRLGAGSMGVAYEAEDLDLARTVALKTLPRVSPDLALRMRQEARSMARVLHPRLAMIFGCESWQGVPVLVLEHLAGTLAARLDCPWRVREALEIGLATAEGLAVMHDHGLLHRDVKPSNIGFAHEGGVKILDFGIAHLLTEAADHAQAGHLIAGSRCISAADLDLSSRVLGTPLYCSPERLEGAPAGPVDDVWSLCLLLYELIAGVHPWRAGTGSVPGNRIPDIRELRGDCPAPVASFLLRALSARVGDRPASARALRAACASLL